ncbi:hypothetical protein GCM10029978_024550 [Actinoallomurus acanthiterrae]
MVPHDDHVPGRDTDGRLGGQRTRGGVEYAEPVPSVQHDQDVTAVRSPGQVRRQGLCRGTGGVLRNVGVGRRLDDARAAQRAVGGDGELQDVAALRGVEGVAVLGIEQAADADVAAAGALRRGVLLQDLLTGQVDDREQARTGLGQVDGGLAVRAYGQVHRAAGLFDADARRGDVLVVGGEYGSVSLPSDQMVGQRFVLIGHACGECRRGRDQGHGNAEYRH